jgi:hypothetical protein
MIRIGDFRLDMAEVAGPNLAEPIIFFAFS